MEPSKIRAIVYADIFDYPLTTAQLHQWQITENLEFKIKNLKLKKTAGFYHLAGREQIVDLRKKREKTSLLKITKAAQAIALLSKIPTIKMVALTGGLAMLNADKDDDIDLLIVAQKGTLWLTRLISTITLNLMGVRRKPTDKTFKDKVCLNMFVEDGHLTLPKKEQDLYGAHEVCQTKPLFDKDNTYHRFLKANSWAKKFLPNAISN